MRWKCTLGCVPKKNKTRKAFYWHQVLPAYTVSPHYWWRTKWMVTHDIMCTIILLFPTEGRRCSYVVSYRMVMALSPPPPPVLLHPKVVLSTIQFNNSSYIFSSRVCCYFSYRPQSADYPRPVPCVDPGGGPTIPFSSFIRC